MKTVEELIREYLPTVNTMQLATSNNDQPWVCTVHYCHDDESNIYWISEKSARHSQEIDQNPKAAATIKIHENSEEESYLIGISIEGSAMMLEDDVEKQVAAKFYIGKHESRQDFIDQVLDKNGTLALYRLKPASLVLFDTKNLKGNPRQEWQV